MDAIICPILMTHIKVAGILCSGNIYEYDAIVQWLEEHDTDPLTNLDLPTKFVVKYHHLASVREKASDIRNSTKGWCKGCYIEDTWTCWENQFTKLKELQPQINDLPNNLLDTYDAHSMEPIDRFGNVGCSFQFINIKDQVYNDKSFKLKRFDMCKMKKCVFVNCSFSDASFIGAVLNNVTFIRCNFIGDRFTLYHATGSPIFIDCAFEFFTWTKPRSQDEIEKIIYHDRQFKGTAQILQ